MLCLKIPHFGLFGYTAVYSRLQYLSIQPYTLEYRAVYLEYTAVYWGYLFAPRGCFKLKIAIVVPFVPILVHSLPLPDDCTPLETNLGSYFTHDCNVCLHIPLVTTRRTHSTKFCRDGTIRLAQFIDNHFRGEKHNCLLPLPLSWCYACCFCCACCVFRSRASESASGSLPTRSTRSAGAKRFTPIIPPPIFFFFAMLSPVYSATHLPWFPMELKRAYSSDNCLLPMRLPWCYIAHVCWVFCVLSFFASDVASGAVLRVLRALQHVFVPTFIGRFAFMVQEPCLHPCTPPHILNGCRRVGSWESGSMRRN